MFILGFGLIGKCAVVFLVVIIKLFFARCYGWGALPAKIDRKSAFWKWVGQYAPNFYAEGDVPTNHFCMDS